MHDIKSILIDRIIDINSLLVLEGKVSKVSFNQQPNSKSNLEELSNVQKIKSKQKNQKICQQPGQKLKQPIKFQPGRQQVNEKYNKSASQQNFRNIYISLKKKQKTRAAKELQILTALNILMFSDRKQIEEFYFLSIEIFAMFDQEFDRYKHKMLMSSVSMEENLKKIYSFFFLKHQKQQQNLTMIPEAMKRQICNLSPSFFLCWISKWSRRLLQQLLGKLHEVQPFIQGLNILKRDVFYQQMSKKQQNNNFNFISKHKSYLQSPARQKKQQFKDNKSGINKFQIKFQKLISNCQLNSNASDSCGLLMLNSKQAVYSYCLQDLRNYYKSLPLQDLDYGYLRNLKKIGRKQQILQGQNLRNMVQTLVGSKNSEIKASITNFEHDYQKFRQIHSPLRQNQDFSQNSNLIKTPKNTSHRSIQNLFNPIKFSSKLLKTSDQNGPQNKVHLIQIHDKQMNAYLHLKDQFLNQSDIKCEVKKSFAQIYQFQQKNIFQSMISVEEAQLERKIRLLKKINQRNQNLSNRTQMSQKERKIQEKRLIQKEKCYFLDEHIEHKHPVSRLPKLVFRDLKKEEDEQNPQKYRSHGSYSKKYKLIQQKNTSFVIVDKRLNKSQIRETKRRFQYREQQKSQQLQQLLSKSKIQLQNKYSINKPDEINRRFSSQTAQKQSQANKSFEEYQRPKTNFSIKQKAFLGSKKTSFNIIKFAKNKTILKNQFAECQNITSVDNQMKDKQFLRNNIDKGLTHTKNPTLFGSQKVPFQRQSSKSDFIRYLKKLQSKKLPNEKGKNEKDKQTSKQNKKQSKDKERLLQ